MLFFDILQDRTGEVFLSYGGELAKGFADEPFEIVRLQKRTGKLPRKGLDLLLCVGGSGPVGKEKIDLPLRRLDGVHAEDELPRTACKS